MLTIAPSSDIADLPRSVGFSLGWRSCQQARRAQMTDEGVVILTCLVRSLAFPLIRQFSRWSNCHLPRIAASPRGKAFGRPHAKKQCAAPVFLPLLRGRWRGAPDEVVDGDDRPPHPSVLPSVEKPSAAAQPHRRSAEKAKPFGFFLRLAPHRRGEGFW